MRNLYCRAARWSCALVVLTVFCGPLVGKEETKPPLTLEERVAKAESDVKAAAMAGHNAWMLTS